MGEKPRVYGDVRYNFIRWLSDKDAQDSFAGIAQFITDPRTGETLSASINLNDFAIKDYYVQRIDFYLQQIGASSNVNLATAWPDLCPDGTMPACTDGTAGIGDCADKKPRVCPKDAVVNTCADGALAQIVDQKVVTLHNTSSSLYGKMQEYLQNRWPSRVHWGRKILWPSRTTIFSAPITRFCRTGFTPIRR